MLKRLINLPTRHFAVLWLACAGLSALIVMQSDTRHLSSHVRLKLANIVQLDDPASLAFHTLTTLNQAIHENDYSWLRQTAAPAFRNRNPEKHLAKIFTPFKKARLALAPSRPDNIHWSSPPGKDEHGRLKMSGTFPVKSGVISFTASYEGTSGSWQLFSIATNFKPVLASPPPHTLPARQADNAVRPAGAQPATLQDRWQYQPPA